MTATSASITLTKANKRYFIKSICRVDKPQLALQQQQVNDINNNNINTKATEKIADDVKQTAPANSDKLINYYYVDYDYPSLVWKNIVIFAILHAIFAYGLYLTLFTINWQCWTFIYGYAILGGLGITAGAHRLWCHKAYKATYSLRFFLMLCNCIAGQNDLIEWCRDHRLHHKFSETDADPHNSNRGWFFAHMGWLMQKKHPKVLEFGRKIDLSDLKADEVLVFQRRYYWPLALTVGLLIPVFACYFLYDLTLIDAISVSIWRYVAALHSTWFVNSAAHIWGSQDYDTNISSRESVLVSIGAIGEGFHNYHHTFPYDYSASEHGGYFNLTTLFIDVMCAFGFAYDLRSVDKKTIKNRRLRTGLPRKQSPLFKLVNKIAKYMI